MIDRLAQEIEEKYATLARQLADPEVWSDQSRFAELSKAHSDLEESHRLAADYLQTRASLEEAESMLDEGGLDPEMKEFLAEE
jgi:peptide chain release factor 1